MTSRTCAARRAIAVLGTVVVVALGMACGDESEVGPAGPSAVGASAGAPAPTSANLGQQATLSASGGMTSSLGPQGSSAFVGEPSVRMAADVDISVFSPTVTPGCGATQTITVGTPVALLLAWEDTSVTGIYWYIEDHHRNSNEGRSTTTTGLTIPTTSEWTESGAQIEVTIVGETATATYPTGTGPGTKVMFVDATAASSVDVTCQGAQGQSAVGPSRSFSEGSVNSFGSSTSSNDHVIYLDAIDAPEPISATFSNVPTSHDGSTFTFDLAFAPEPEISFRVLKFHAFEVEGGSIHRTPRKVRGSNQTWTVHVTPSGTDDVTITLRATTDCEDDSAICSAEGGMLNHSTTATVSGP